MDNTLQKEIPEETIRRIRSGHTGTRLAPKYKGKYGKLNENNIGVFQGSAISALLFIIYLGDMMGDLEALNRRTNLPMRIIQDRPHEQKKELLWNETQEAQGEQNTYEEITETNIIRNYTHENTQVRIVRTNQKQRTGGVKKLRKQLEQKYKNTK